MIASYLAAERELGRVAPDVEVDVIAPMLVGAGHLLYADPEHRPAGRRGGAQDGDHGPGRAGMMTTADASSGCRGDRLTRRGRPPYFARDSRQPEGADL